MHFRIVVHNQNGLSRHGHRIAEPIERRNYRAEALGGSTRNDTLRFVAWSHSAPPVRSGWESATPATENKLDGTPSDARASLTLTARSRESLTFASPVPTSSVWPVIAMRASGLALRTRSIVTASSSMRP